MKLHSEQPRRRPSPKWPLLLLGPILYYTFQRFKNGVDFNLDQTLLSVPSAEHARNWSAFYTTGTHLPGQGLEQAQWTEEKWKEFGLSDSQILSYDTDLPTVIGQQRVALFQDSNVLYEAPLVDGQNDPQDFAPAYFAFSTNGNISASYVFVNFGGKEDFEALARANVSVEGKIAVLKLADVSPYLLERGINIFRGEQIKNCESRGVAGVLIYPDPQNDGPITDSNGYEPFPDGPARPPTLIERDRFQNGYLPTIPCIPISYADAIPILTALNGYGPLASDFDERWHGGGLEYRGVHYNVGPSPDNVYINLISHAEINPGQVHNVIATIPGEVPDEVVILGNHRDAWGPGAGDPGSGSAALNEVIRSFGVAVRKGWRPHRTLMFASWEGEEFGQVGSLAWIQANLPWVNATAVAYLNVVVAAGGRSFHVKASPLLYDAIHDATQRVQSPDQPGQTVFDVWDKKITTAGGGDAIYFSGAACVSAVDMGFIPGMGDSPFTYHSGFDTHAWMDRIGDPGWQHHVATAKVWSLLAARLAEARVLQMHASDYAVALREWLDNLFANDSWPQVDSTVLYDAVGRLSQAAKQFDADTASLAAYECPWWNFWSDCGLEAAYSVANKKYMGIERAFYYDPDQDDNPPILEDVNPFFYHVLYQPGAWYADAPAFPGLRNSLSVGDWTSVKASRIPIHFYLLCTDLSSGGVKF
ncbi:Dethiobiotin synthase BioD [Penicillium cf. griseofulvum]|nr:Dethiobiotin synthase BioD [Penicillium cf. griseofulvum]